MKICEGTRGHRGKRAKVGDRRRQRGERLRAWNERIEGLMKLTKGKIVKGTKPHLL